MKYYSIGQFSKLIGKTSQTLREWDKKDILKPHHVAPTGYMIKELLKNDTVKED